MKASSATNGTSTGPLHADGTVRAISLASWNMSTIRKSSNPMVSARMASAARELPQLLQEREPEQPERHRHEADVEADQRKAGKGLAIGTRRFDRHRHLGREDDPGLRDEGDRVLALDPRIGDCDGRRAELAISRPGTISCAQ